MPAFVESRVFEVHGLRLHVSIRGNGPPLLLINGLGGLIRSFDPLRAELRDYQTITFDVPGIGKSQRPESPLRLPKHADIIAELLNLLGIQRADVFGVSWGGALAQEFALRHPGRVRRLILAATSAGPVLLMQPAGVLAFIGPGRKTSQSVGAAQVGPGRNSLRGLLRAGSVRRMLSLSTGSYYHQLRAVLGWTSLTRLWRLRMPTLILVGEEDPVTCPYNARILHRAIRGSVLEVLQGEGHFFIVTSPAETAELIRQFLQNSPRLLAPAAPARRALGRKREVDGLELSD